MNRRQRRRRAQLRRALAIGPFVGLLGWYATGLRLPAVHVEEARVIVPGLPETVWAILMDLDAMPSWRDDVTAVERLPDAGGSVRWIEIADGVELPLERVEAVTRERLVVRTVGGELPLRRWTYRILPTPGGTVVSVAEERRLPPLARPLASLLGTDRRRIEAVIHGLAGRVAGWREVAVGRRGRGQR